MVITASHSGQYVLAIFASGQFLRTCGTRSPSLVGIVAPIFLIVEGKVHLEGIDTDDFPLHVTLTTPDRSAHLGLVHADHSVAIWTICLGHFPPTSTFWNFQHF
jgi:hypothetical protein